MLSTLLCVTTFVIILILLPGLVSIPRYEKILLLENRSKFKIILTSMETSLNGHLSCQTCVL